ncbi:MAG TPA: hypothetical protein VD766_03205 [Solirubrobacterales bacterium]|nr:hypothetical protein [Solirubrobacterales bacterium]
MIRKLGSHLRDQWMGALALFIVLGGGTAYAANTVFSSDIVNNEVYGADVRDDSLSGGGLGHVDLKAGSVRSSEVGADSLKGGDIAEETLDPSTLGDDEGGVVSGWEDIGKNTAFLGTPPPGQTESTLLFRAHWFGSTVDLEFQCLDLNGVLRSRLVVYTDDEEVYAATDKSGEVVADVNDPKALWQWEDPIADDTQSMTVYVWNPLAGRSAISHVRLDPDRNEGGCEAVYMNTVTRG